MHLTTKDLTPALWPDLDALFGANGACGGCWCMHWRIAKGERWDELKGAPNRARLRELVRRGEALGVLAYADDEPVGWCTYGPRPSFDRLNRAPSFACDDAADVWSIPCFFIARGFRGQGVGSALLAAAIELARARGAKVLEGYPVRQTKPGKLPAAFAWTGTQPLFRKAGFRVVGNADGGKQRVRKEL